MWSYERDGRWWRWSFVRGSIVLCHHADTQTQKLYHRLYTFAAADIGFRTWVCRLLPFAQAMAGCDTTPVRWRSQSVARLAKAWMLCVTDGRSYEKVSNSSTTAPTSAAASYHSARVYLLVQQWIGKGDDLDPEEWSWVRVRNRLEPRMTDLPQTPEAILKVDICACKHDFDTQRCFCKKHGLDCSVACGNARASAARTRRCCQQRSLTTLTKRVASLKWWIMRTYVNFNCTWMLSVLAYMPNVISSEFVIGYDGEFANNTLVTINLLGGATH